MRFFITIAMALCAAANGQEIEIVPPILKPVPISAIASDGVDAIAVRDSTLITRITSDGRSLTPTGARIAPRAFDSAIAYGNGEYLVAVRGATFDAVLLRRDGSVIRRVHLANTVFGRPIVASSGASFLVAAGRQAFVLDLAGNPLGSTSLPDDALAAAGDGKRFLVVGQQKAMIVRPTGALGAANDFTTTNTYSNAVAVAFDGSNYVVAWNESVRNLARHVTREGLAFGDPIRLPDGHYQAMQALSEDHAVVVAMTSPGSPFSVSRVTANGITTVTPPLATPLLAPVGSGFIAVDDGATFLTHDFAIDDSRPKGTVVAQAAESIQLMTSASSGTSVLAVWARTPANDGMYASVIGPGGALPPIHLDGALHVAVASNGRDFLVVESTSGGAYVLAIRADGTATEPVGFRSFGSHDTLYLGAQWTGDAYLVQYAEVFDVPTEAYEFHRIVSADGALIGPAGSGGPGSRFACGKSTCVELSLGQNTIWGTRYDLRGAFLRSYPLSPQYDSSPTVGDVVFDGANFRAVWSVSSKAFATTMTEGGDVGKVLSLPSSAYASYAATGDTVLGAWSAASNEIGTLFIDRNDQVLLGPRIMTNGLVFNVTATTSWLGPSLLYTRWTDDTVHGSAARTFLRPVAPGHDHAARR